MSFLGSLGTLMAGSGLTDIMECCYGPNTIKHIMSGKAVARAVRAHFLIDSALKIILLKAVTSSGMYDSQMAELKEFYNSIVSNGYDDNTVQFPESFFDIELTIKDIKSSLAQQSRTAKL